MRTLNIFLISFCCLLLNISKLRAQKTEWNADDIIQKIENYGSNEEKLKLFLHFDKTLYTNNEGVWFTGYLLDADSTQIDNHRQLLLAFVRNDDKHLAIQQAFVMDAGLCFGNLTLPDSLRSGDYTFIAYTNLFAHGKPDVVFKQPVTIRNTDDFPLALSTRLIENGDDPGNINIHLSVKGRDSLPVTSALIKLDLNGRNIPLSDKIYMADGNGNYVFKIAKSIVTQKEHVLTADVTSGKRNAKISLNILSDERKLSVRFYPEGGSLVLGKQSIIGWEVRGQKGKLSAAKGVLFADKEKLATIETNSFGMGKFVLIPKKNVVYTVKLQSYGGKDTSFTLPAALSKGMVIGTGSAWLTDNLNIHFQATDNGTYTVLLHNFKHVYQSTSITLSNLVANAAFALEDVPRGLSAITVFDSLGRPVAERAFFAHYNSVPQLSLATNANTYSTRKKVSLKIKLNQNLQSSSGAYVSVACVQENRLDAKKPNHIQHFCYLEQELGSLPPFDDYQPLAAANKEYMELLLLIRGWTKYSWQDILNKEVDQSKHDNFALTYSGRVTYNKLPLKKPVTLILFKDTLTQIINTNSDGTFVLQPDDLTITAGKMPVLVLNTKLHERGYNINFDDPFINAAAKLTGLASYQNFDLTPGADNAPFVDQGAQKIIKLKEVTIKANKNTDVYGSPELERRLLGVNECGDWLCSYNILNCGYHGRDGSVGAPVKGQLVKVWQRGHIVDIIYRGCVIMEKKEANNFLRINGVYAAKEFYGANYDEEKDPSLQYNSTIYWHHQIPVDSNGEATVSFFTSDLKGRFRVIAQGVAGDDVVYGQTTFDVKQ